ncbi:glycosyl hydrolase [Quadrisphaera setariae]|nr:glycosyl hydrolase [Quadrisphaera setariae]
MKTLPSWPLVSVVAFPTGQGIVRVDNEHHRVQATSLELARTEALAYVAEHVARVHGRAVRVDAHDPEGYCQLMVTPEGAVRLSDDSFGLTTPTPPAASGPSASTEAFDITSGEASLPRQLRWTDRGQVARVGGTTLLAATVIAAGVAASGHLPRRQSDIALTAATPTATPTPAAAPVRATLHIEAEGPVTATLIVDGDSQAAVVTNEPTATEAQPAQTTAAPSAASSTFATGQASTSTPIPTASAAPAVAAPAPTTTPSTTPSGRASASTITPAASVPSNATPVSTATARPSATPTSAATALTRTTASASPSAGSVEANGEESDEPTWTAADDAELDEAIDAMTRAGDNADALAQAGITADPDRVERPSASPTDSATSTLPAGEGQVTAAPSAAPTGAPTATATASSASTSTPAATSTPSAQPTATQRAGAPASTSTAEPSTEPTAEPTAEAAAEPTAGPTSTTTTREQQPAPVPVPDDEDEQQELGSASSTTSPTGEQTRTTAPERTDINDATTTATATAGGGWLSGASGDGADDGQLGAWRGKPIAIGGTWADRGDNQTELWSIADGGEWAGFDGALDIAPGGLLAGESWSAAASGAYDDRWRASLAKMADLRAGAGTTYIRPFHEFNLGGWDWSVQPGDAEDFKTAWARYRDIQREVFPEAKLVYGVNVTSSGTDLDWRTTWPGKDNADVLGVDTYNGWPTINSDAQFNEQANARGDGGIPIGLNAYSEQAREWGVPLAVPEWSGRAEMGDEAAYVEGMTSWFAQNAGSGPGQLLYEIVFNAPQDDNNFKLFGDTRMPESSAAYQQAYSDGVASSTAAPAPATSAAAPAPATSAAEQGEQVEQGDGEASEEPTASTPTAQDAGDEPTEGDVDQRDQAQDERVDEQEDGQAEDSAATTSSTTEQPTTTQRSTSEAGGPTAGARTAGTVAADSAGGWLSGAAGDGVVDGSLGQWRGKPVQIAGTWQDTGDAQTQMWNLSPGEEFGDWDKPLDLAPGGFNDGDTWAAAASGAYDDRWREGLTKAASYRQGKGTTYIRPFHEFNGTWYPWSVAPGQEEIFKTAWARYRAIQQEVFPSAKLVYNPNVNSTGGLDWRKSWPGADQVDVLGVDMYNGSPKRYDSAEEWASGLDVTGDDGIPIGLNAYAAQAREWGVPLAVPEWSGRAEQGDDPAFITGIGTWFAENAGSGPGQLLYEVMFNVDRNNDNFRLFNGTRMPQSAEAYREVFSRPAANGGGESSGATAVTAASRDQAPAEDEQQVAEDAGQSGGDGDAEQSGDVNATAGFEDRTGEGDT